MTRLHVSLSVKDVEASVQFYTHLFSSHPTVQRNDYAKWLLDDPRVNFSIIGPSETPGLNHLGIQVDTAEELELVHTRMLNTQGPVSELAETTCCYARGKKGWATDPQGISWEGFFTEQDGLQYFGNTAQIDFPAATADRTMDQTSGKKACCT